MLRSHEKILSRWKVLKLWKKKIFFQYFFIFHETKTLFFYAKNMCRNFCRTIKFFSENDALDSFFKSRGSLIKKYSVNKKLWNFQKKKKLKFFEFFWIFFMKFCELFSKENFFWLKISKKCVFFQSCGTFYLLNIFSWGQSMR